MSPLESLDVLASVLQQISLPAVAADGQLSHRVISEHLQTIHAALQPPPEPELNIHPTAKVVGDTTGLSGSVGENSTVIRPDKDGNTDLTGI